MGSASRAGLALHAAPEKPNGERLFPFPREMSHPPPLLSPQNAPHIALGPHLRPPFLGVPSALCQTPGECLGDGVHSCGKRLGGLASEMNTGLVVFTPAFIWFLLRQVLASPQQGAAGRGSRPASLALFPQGRCRPLGEDSCSSAWGTFCHWPFPGGAWEQWGAAYPMSPHCIGGDSLLLGPGRKHVLHLQHCWPSQRGVGRVRPLLPAVCLAARCAPGEEASLGSGVKSAQPGCSLSLCSPEQRRGQ